ncbi:cyclopropane fatty acyl phospholipid synthase [Desulfonatronovibrio magnus]|uniref:cyclopropane fatty acyl phospholipid synthase n=1 Tax=Desulfonatronovibrio magnus TaxID=698827 RepID=UPI0005EB3592|nr:cyclopropane fatty acyl phospholipid synthase [Desulfonatronovibrio magnus]
MIAGTIRDLLDQAGITVNGSKPWDIHVYDDQWYKRVWKEKSLGFGESYMEGLWDCQRIDHMVCRLFKSDLVAQVRGSITYQMQFLAGILFNLQSRMRSRIVAERHYDLGNDLYFSFLDPYLQYSCAYFDDTDDLNEAQQKKLNLIAKKLALKPSDTLMDIGSGWGGLARFMAEKQGCEVTGVNISKEQLKHSRELCRGLPVKFFDQDYRTVKGKYDKIVSVGMFEHVGQKNYRDYMNAVDSCLKDDGIFMLQTIGCNESKKTCDPWITKYIFPNGMLPSISQVASSAEGLLNIQHLENLGPHYDRTLMAWHSNFQKAWPELYRKNKKYDQRFKRMWEFYLQSCAGGFRAGINQLWQIVMTKHLPERKSL